MADDTSGVLHVLKFADPDVWAQNVRLFREVYEIEMAVREAISFAFLSARPDRPLDFLDLTTATLASKPPPGPEQLATHGENQLFHVSFTAYAALNKQKPVTPEELLKLVQSLASFDAVRAALDNPPIPPGTGSDFVAALQRIVDPVEKVRNCVAHNRRVPDATMRSYPAARARLLREVEAFWAATANDRPDGG